MKLRSLFDRKKCVFSFEIFPPKADAAPDSVTAILPGLARLAPDYVSITYGAGGSGSRNLTADLAKQVKAHGVEPLAHLTCMGNDAQSVRRILDDLAAGGIENVLALRGDRRPDLRESPDFAHASDLAAFLRRDGRFNIAGACYPEGHFESESLDADLRNLKKKIDAGVTHLNTQLFFDNEDFYAFRERAQKAGIDVPIQAGIMPVVRPAQIRRIVSLAGVKIPNKLSRLFARFGEDERAMRDAGIAYATDQIADLIAAGADGVHLYIMNNLSVAETLTANVSRLLESRNAEPCKTEENRRV